MDNRYDISAIPIRHFIQYRIARYGLPCERAIIALSRHDLQQPHAVMVELLLLCILRALRLAARPTRTRATPPLTFCLQSLVLSDLSFLPSFSFFDMSARAFLRSRFSFSFAAAFRLRSMIMSYSPRTLRGHRCQCPCWVEPALGADLWGRACATQRSTHSSSCAGFRGRGALTRSGTCRRGGRPGWRASRPRACGDAAQSCPEIAPEWS